MTAFFAWHRKHKKKKKKFSRSKIRNKNPRHVFLDFVLFFNIAMEKFDLKKIGQVGALKAQNIPILGPNFRNSVK